MNPLDALKKYNESRNKYTRHKKSRSPAMEPQTIEQQTSQGQDWIMARANKLDYEDKNTIITIVLINNGDCYVNRSRRFRTEFDVSSVLTKYKTQHSKAWFRSSFSQQHLRRNETIEQWIQRMHVEYGYIQCNHLGKITVAQLKKETK
jgi:hypothetical protein